jgi:hypothetical protein
MTGNVRAPSYSQLNLKGGDMKKVVFVLIALVLISAGCAAIFKGSGSEISSKALSGTADIYVDGSKVGQTPMTLKLNNSAHKIELKKEDGTTKVFMVNPSVGGGWIVADILLTGLIGIIVDAATGSWNYLEPHEVIIDDPIGNQTITLTPAEEVWHTKDNPLLHKRITVDLTK